MSVSQSPAPPASHRGLASAPTCRARPRVQRPLPLALLVLGAGTILPSPVPALEAQEPAPAIPEGPFASVIGSWEGSLSLPGGASLTLVLHFELLEDGSLTARMDSPDQGVVGIPVDEVVLDGATVAFGMPSIAATFEGTIPAPDQMEGSWRQGGGAFPLALRRVAEVTVRSRPQDPAPPLPYRAEDVRYPNPAAGLHLAGTLTLPEGVGPFPAVVLISGSGAQDRDSALFGHRPFLVLADHLTRHGIAVLRSDDRGVGESEGVFAEATSQDFAGDAAAAADYLRSRPEIDPDAVGLVGLSEGGLIAPMVATATDEIAFLVLLAGPGLPGEDILYLQSDLISRAMGASEDQIDQNRRLQERLFAIVREAEDPAERRDRLDGALREGLEAMSEADRAQVGLTPEAEEGWITSQLSAVGGPWFRYFLLHDPRPVLREVRIPVLALNGALDLQVPPTENLRAIEEALREGGNPDFTTRELPRLNHLFQTATTGAPAEYGSIEETMSPEAMEIIARWILERAGRTP